MHELLQSDHFIIQARFRILPRLTTRFNVVDDNNKTIGTMIFHPAWSYPVLWMLGFLVEVGLMAGGVYMAIKMQQTSRYIGIGMALLGALMVLLFRFHSFLATRSPSSVEIRDSKNEILLTSRKGWALFQPLFTISNAQGQVVGTSRQSFVWGDRKYLLWDDQEKKWGHIKRRVLGFHYRIYRNGKAIARFRKTLFDTRKMLGLRSYLLEFHDHNLTTEERALVLGTIANVEVLTRQKKLREEKEATPKPKAPTKE